MSQATATSTYPTLAGCPNSFTASSWRVAAIPFIKCHLRVTTESGETRYDALFPSTCDAVIAATERLGLRPGKVSARALP